MTILPNNAWQYIVRGKTDLGCAKERWVKTYDTRAGIIKCLTAVHDGNYDHFYWMHFTKLIINFR